MKSMMKKKSILIAVLAVLLIGTGVAATLAYLSDKEEALVNTFKVGNVTTEIIEDIFKQETDTIFAKEPYVKAYVNFFLGNVKNTGENDCYVRARVVCSPEEAFEELVINENWELNPSNPTDGFYYYVGNKGKEDGILLAPGEGVEEAATETEPIFTQVEIKGDNYTPAVNIILISLLCEGIFCRLGSLELNLPVAAPY